LPGTPIHPVLFTGFRDDGAVQDFPEMEIVRTAVLDRNTPSWLARKIVAKTTSEDIVLRRLLQRNHISVVSHSFHLGFHPGRHFALKTIGWIPDFQHLHMPEFFGAERCRALDRDFRLICRQCDIVIVSSEIARADMRVFSPENAHKAELLRFIANPAQSIDAPSLEDLKRLYGFSTPYFLLPNQFWMHKNHRVVLSALRNLKERGKSYVVLATGSTKDFRDPSFFSSLMQYAAQCGVLDSFRVLGQIPYDHLVGLMRHAVAFMNPSLFEGWSTSVEEAKSMGKQIVLSDIPVHREQAPERGFYFSAQDPDALTAAMIAAYDGFDARTDSEMQDVALSRFPARQQEFGEIYRRIIERLKA